MRSSSITVDRFGLTWHPSIAASVLSNLDRIDVIEVIPEGLFLDSRQARRALRRLARTVPVSIHGVSLGLASAAPIDLRRVDRFARLVGEVEPESWSEHLAFVRAGDIELGHLAAPPRTAITIEAVAEHVELARRRVGCYPSVENVATALEPPGSDRSELTWLLDVLAASPSDLLLDLHNLYANGTNFGFDPAAALRAIPAGRIGTIHIAGGVDVGRDGEERRIDDHLHDVPDPVYQLLEIVGERVPHAVDVVLERDGAFPPFEQLVAQLDRAREALARGRARRIGGDAAQAGHTESRAWTRPSTQGRQECARLEHYLARLYTDDRLRARFLQAPLDVTLDAGLTSDHCRELASIDRTGLHLAAASFAKKRAGSRIPLR